MPRTKKEEETIVETTPVVEETKEVAEFTVADPTIVRPKELPLIIKPTAGGWKNDAQARFAQTLNAYAYKNPAKWEEKKDGLLKQLSEMGKNPSLINLVTGNEGSASRLKYGNQLIQTAEDNQ